jgi:hypothetical protein
MRRRAILVGGATSVLMTVMPALAQEAGSWDGTWSGSTERGGGSVKATLSRR